MPHRQRRGLFRGLRRGRRFPIRTLIGLGLFIALLISAERRLSQVIAQMAESRAKNIAQSVINQAIEEGMKNEQINYDDLVYLEKDNNGQITALKSNIIESNRIKSVITQDIMKRLTDIPSSQLSIPIGNLVNGGIFSGRGPKIPIHLTPLGSVSAAFRHNFSSAGINQTRHQIVFDAKVSIVILLPGKSVSAQVSGEVTIAETVIVGSVPGSYTFFDTGGLISNEASENTDPAGN